MYFLGYKMFVNDFYYLKGLEEFIGKGYVRGKYLV